MPSALAMAAGPKPLCFHFTLAGIDAVRLRSGDAFHLALFPEIGLELGKHPQHVEEALPRGRPGVDRLLGGLQGDATPSEVMDDVLQVA
jgi:hypothetical protein